MAVKVLRAGQHLIPGKGDIHFTAKSRPTLVSVLSLSPVAKKLGVDLPPTLNARFKVCSFKKSS